MTSRYSAELGYDPALYEMLALARMYRLGSRAARSMRVRQDHDPARLETALLAARGALELRVTSYLCSLLGPMGGSRTLVNDVVDAVIDRGNQLACVQAILFNAMTPGDVATARPEEYGDRAVSLLDPAVGVRGRPRRTNATYEELTSFQRMARELEAASYPEEDTETLVEVVDAETGELLRLGKDGYPISRSETRRKMKAEKAAEKAAEAKQKPKPLTLRQKLRGRPDELKNR